jgi:hypothetical protein
MREAMIDEVMTGEAMIDVEVTAEALIGVEVIDAMVTGGQSDLAEVAEARTLNRLPFLGPIFAVGWPLDDPGGPRNQLKKSQKAGGSA